MPGHDDTPPAGGYERKRELGIVLRLGLSSSLTGLLSMLMGMVDMMMVGRIGVEALDAVALGRTWFMGTMVVALGVVFGMEPLFTQAIGAKDHERGALEFARTCWASIWVGGLVFLMWMPTEPALIALGQDPHLAEAAAEYLRLQSFSIPFFLLYHASAQFARARDSIWAPVWVALVLNLYNVAANWVLIWGNLGAPVLGLRGAAIATATTRVLMCVLLALFLMKGRWKALRLWWASRPEGWSGRVASFETMRLASELGLPVAATFALEIWAFEISTLMAGWIGPKALAAHAILLNLLGLAFMVPLGLAMGGSIHIGRMLGASRAAAAKMVARDLQMLGSTLMLGVGLLLLLFGSRVSVLFTDEPEVGALVASCMILMSLFQVFDGLQAISASVLRALKRTRPAMIGHAFAFYAVALPLGYWLAFVQGTGFLGIWLALSVGIMLVALWLAWQAHRPKYWLEEGDLAQD